MCLITRHHHPAHHPQVTDQPSDAAHRSPAAGEGGEAVGEATEAVKVPRPATGTVRREPNFLRRRRPFWGVSRLV